MSRQTRHGWSSTQTRSSSTRRRRGELVRLPQRRHLHFESLEDRRLLSITVNTLVDEDDGISLGDISLRDAIAAAAPGETIDFSVTGTITLQHGELAINKDLQIAGPGAKQLTIDANGASRVFLIDDGNNSALSDVSIADVTITGGATPVDGAGIFSRERLSLVRSAIVDNQSGEDGGGIASFFGPLTIVDSTISGNSAAAWGGGIFLFSETPAVQSLVRNSTISGNTTQTRGGGINNFYGTLLIEYSTITENEAPDGEGSGVSSWAGTNALTRVRSSIIAGNVNSDADQFPTISPVTFQSLGYNLIGFGNAASFFLSSGDQRFVADPLLEPLADNGGPTMTHLPMLTSPAVDTGDPDAEAGVGNVPEFDQRGLPFQRVADGDDNGTARIDIGAYEATVVYVVDTLLDEDDGIGVGTGTSLRDAIVAANSSLASPFIQFDSMLTSGGPAVIELLLGPLEITGSMSVVGPGATLLTIDAQQNSRILAVDDLDGSNLLQVSLSGVTLTGGNAEAGGAVFSQEFLNLTDSIVSGNSANLGGGVYNGVNGELTLLRSEVSGNSATAFGGGVFNAGGSVTIRESTISGNDASDGAGAHNAYYGYLAVRGSDVSGNIGTGAGGGIKNDGSAVVEKSRISGNSALAGGGIYTSPYNYLSIARSTVSGNTATGGVTGGGGLFNNHASVYLSDSTLSENMASYGGALYSAGPDLDSAYTRVTNSTISGNTANVTGGAMYLFGGRAVVEFSTIAFNHAPEAAIGGIGAQHPNFAQAELYHTILAGNDHFDAGPTAEINSFVSLGFNLIGVVDESVDTFVEAGDQVGITDPKLGPLANNGGPTKTHALLAGSPAIDSGDPNAIAGQDGVPAFDQRGEGYLRVRDGDAAEDVAIDVGAFEVQQFVAVPELLGDYNGDNFVDAADYTVWRNTLGDEVEKYFGADGDGDGVIGPDDYGVWKAHFGESLEGEGAVAEPLALSGAGSVDGVITVTTLDDTIDFGDGLTSLREAIFAANTVSGPNTIEFAASLTDGGPATILLTLGELAIADAVVVNGPGAELLTIDASGNDPNPNVHGDGSRIFNIDDGSTFTAIHVEIRGLTLTGGDASQFGGAILSRELLHAEQLVMTGNWATIGGAIALFAASGESTIANSSISENTAASHGGAIYVQGSPFAIVTIRDSMVLKNQAGRGGALYAGQSAPGASLILSGNTLAENAANLQGGAIVLVSSTSPRTSIQNSILSGNTSGHQGGALYANGVRELAIIDSQFVANESSISPRSMSGGGAIYSRDSDLAITGTTITGNTAASGGGINSRNGELTINFSIIAGNTATAGDGGGIYSNLDRLSIASSTISGNNAVDFGSRFGRGGGLWHASGPSTPTTILNTSFLENSSSYSGGGAEFRSTTGQGGSALSLINTDFARNSSIRGGGISLGEFGRFMGSVAIDGGSIHDNSATMNGGGIYGSPYSLLVHGTTITGNHADGNGGGLATPLSNFPSINLSFVGATIAQNSAGNDSSPNALGIGGGIYVPAGTVFMTLLDTEVSQNSARIGGGIARGGPQQVMGSLNAIDSTISGNTSLSHGGGIYNLGGALSFTRSTIANNLAATGPRGLLANGGGVFSRFADVTLVESSLTGNSTDIGRGGGLYMGATGDLNVNASTVAGNFAWRGGGGVFGSLQFNERALIQSSTISGNSSAQGTGGIYLRGIISIRHSTITNNTGGGTRPGGLLAGDGAQQLELDHSIVAGNSHTSGGPPDVRWFTNPTNVTVRSSLIGDNTSTTLVEAPIGSPDANGNLIGMPVGAGGSGVIHPLLAPLAANGGSTLTHALLPGSPALDGGALVTGTPQGFDQRGNPYSRMVDGTGDGVIRIDVGAYESQGVPSFTPGDYNRDGMIDTCDYTVWRNSVGTIVAPLAGADGNGDGTIDIADYQIWKSHFGEGLTITTGGMGSAFGAMDESAAPATSALAPPLAGSARIDRATRVTGRITSRSSAAVPTSDALLAWLATESHGVAASDEAIAELSDADAIEIAECDSMFAAFDLALAAFGG